MHALKRLLLAGALLLPSAAAAQDAAPSTPKPSWEPKKTWVFAVGILEWASPSFAPFPKKNRRDAKLVRLFKKRGVPDDQVVFLKDGEATLAKTRAALKTLLARTRAGDLLVFYFAGHGTKDKTGAMYFVPYDTDPKKLKTTAWPAASLLTTLETSFQGSRVLLTADCCYSGSLAKLAPKRAKRLAYAALTSSLASAPSTGNWTFTEGLLAGLRGRPWVDANGDGAIALQEIAGHIRKDMSFAEGQLSSFAVTKGFAAATVVAQAQPRAGKRLGERLEAEDQGKWWRARVVAAKDGKVKVHYFGWDASYDVWLAGDSKRLRPYRPKVRAVGTWVRVEWKKEWYAGKVLEVVDGVHRIHYTGFESVWDEWVAPQRIRALGLKVGLKIAVHYLKDKSWYPAKILALKGAKVHVDYDGYDDSWNEWVPIERVRLP